MKRMRNGGWRARSVLECGSPLPLSSPDDRHARCQSARGLAQSKTWRPFKALTLLAQFSIALSASAQSYSLDWSKVAGGGGTCTGGVYSVSATIGQPDASGAVSGGNYSLTGGFWSLISVVQTAGAPTLTITINHQLSTINIAWPYPSSGWTLQQNASVANAAGWTASGYTVTTNGSIVSITITPPAGKLFFRLAN